MVWDMRVPSAEAILGTDDPLLETLRQRVFLLVLAVGAAALGAIGARGFLLGGLRPWADVAAAAAMAGGFALVRRRPSARPGLAWILLVLLFADVLDGLGPSAAWPVTSTHLLLPLLV